MTDTQARECPKCGADLPIGEEVLCQNCGTAFGGKTTVMSAINPEDYKKHKKNAATTKAASKEAAQAAEKPASKFPFLILASLSLLAVICIVVLVFLLTK